MKIHTRLPYTVAESLANACRTEALAIGIPMAVAVVDAEGGSQLFLRMDGTLPASTELSVSKAYTAAIFRMPTHELGSLARPGAMMPGIESSHNGRVILFGGGFPLRLQGAVVGAVGVSGGSVDQDMRVALPALQLLFQMEGWMEKIAGLISADLVVPREGCRARDELQRNILSRLEPSPALEAIPALVGGLALALT